MALSCVLSTHSRPGTLQGAEGQWVVPHPVIDVDVHVTLEQQPYNICVATHAGQ